jgi:hypothetical protein
LRAAFIAGTAAFANKRAVLARSNYTWKPWEEPCTGLQRFDVLASGKAELTIDTYIASSYIAKTRGIAMFIIGVDRKCVFPSNRP